MLRVFRHYFFVIAGLFLIGAGSPSSGSADQQEAPSQKAELVVGEVVEPIIQATEISSLNKPCQQGVDERRSDLCAQWKAADAAERSANATWTGTIVGSLTLVAAVAAAVFAGIAASHNRDANIITRQVGQAQARAYLSVKSARLNILDGLPYWELAVENSGQSPAAVANVTTIPEISYLDFNKNPKMPQLTQMDFSESESKVGAVAPGELRQDIRVPFLPKVNGNMPYDQTGNIILAPITNCTVKATFFLTWIDVFGVECDCSGSLLVRTIRRTSTPVNGIKAVADADIRTSVYDTAAWLSKSAKKNNPV